MERVNLGIAALATIAIPTMLVMCLREPAREPVSIAKLLPTLPTVAPTTVPAPAPKPEAPPPRPPNVTTQCMTPEMTLANDDGMYALCIPNVGCFDQNSSLITHSLVTTSVSEPVAVAELGPRLRAAVANGEVDATPDHSIVLVGSTPWNRDTDRPLHLPKVARGWSREGDRAVAKILGTHVLVARSWDPDVAPPPPWAPDRAYILDAAGQVTAMVAIDHDLATVALGDDSFLVPNGAGGFSLVVHGLAVSFGDLATWREEASSIDGDPALRRIEGQHIPLQMIQLTEKPAYDETTIDGTVLGRQREAAVAASWCDEEEEVCHVARVAIEFHVSKHGKRTQGINVADHVYPLCR
jgi:hypothetical protein